MHDAQAAVQHAYNEARAGRADQAQAYLDGVIRTLPGDPELRRAAGRVAWFRGDKAAAAEHLQAACMLLPHDATIRLDLARAYWGLQRFGDAAGAYREALRLDPLQQAIWAELGRLLLDAGEFEQAWRVFEDSARRTPQWPGGWTEWAYAALRAGEVPEAMRVTKMGLEHCPGDIALLGVLCYILNYADDQDPAEVLEWHRRLAGPALAVPAFGNPKDPGRALRVAFVSGDFRYHACAFFLAGLISAIDRGRVQPYCYASNEPDAVTQSFAQLATLRDIRQFSDAQVAAMARQDGIDVAIDCSGWSTSSRVRAFASHLAPVQFTYLGYPNTTGLAAVGYRITDAIADPPGSEPWCTERLVRLPHAFICFTIPEHTPPVRLSRALAGYASGGVVTAPVTFGVFNRLEKAQDRCLRLWARIMRATPGARLLVRGDASTGVRASVSRRYAAAGGDPAGLAWSPYERDPARHLDAFNEIDVALDPFPYNGTTTTCETLLMSVPVVTLRGTAHRARVGASLLTAAGLPECIAESEDGYVSLASGLARDPARLLAYRRTIRPTMMASPLCDARGYARDFEAALRDAWRAWCAGGNP